ncbi:MAG: hypothetical protein HOD64_05410 [Candidatus Cloacimonetes bacterium]|jgi:hypothetical protein|nr:hypothetical protein [Candidatus Cloacimonadota bacterium]
MNAEDLLEFGRQFSNLGWSIQDQIQTMLDGDFSDINPNAFRIAKQKLSGYSEDLDNFLLDCELNLKHED